MNIYRDNIKYAGCNSEMHNIFQTSSAYSFSKNRVLARPLSGGVSLGNYLNMYGTLGGLFRDNTDGTIVGLTCRHVCDQMTIMSSGGNAVDRFGFRYSPGYDFLRTRYTSLSDRLSPDFLINENTVLFASQYPDNYNREYAEIRYRKTYQNIVYELVTEGRTSLTKNMNIVNKPMYQPGYPIFQPTVYANFINNIAIPGFSVNNFNISRPYPQTIGHIKRVVPLKTDLRLYNEVDSGVIAIEKSPNEDLILDQSSCNFVGFNKTGGSVFATTREINSLSANPSTPLFKTGAGTGSTGFGAIDTSCHTLSFSRFYDFIGVEGVNYSNGIAFSMIDNTGDIRVNLLSASNLFSNVLYGGYWVKPNTLLEDSVDPFGVVNSAWSFRMSSATGSPQGRTCGFIVGGSDGRRFANIIPDNTDVTVSMWVKADPGLVIDDILLGIGDYSMASIKNKISTQWQRFSYTGKYRSIPAFSSTGPRGFQFIVTRTASTNLNHKIYIYGAQLEIGNGMTNYIETPNYPFVQYNGTKRINYLAASENFGYGNGGTGYIFPNAVGPDRSWFRTGGVITQSQGLKNKVKNSTGTGVQTGLLGGGGTLPITWYSDPKSFSGMDVQVVATGVEDDVNYIDIRLFGNATPRDYMFHNLYFTGWNIPAAFGQTWNHSMYYKVINAATTNNINVIMLLNAINGPSGYLGEINSATYLPKGVDSTLTRYSISGTITNNTVQTITPYLQLNFINPNQFVDVTIRVAAPQVEWGAEATPYTPTVIIANPQSTDLLSVSSADMTRFTADNFTGTGGDTYLWQRVTNLTPGVTGTFSCWMASPHVLSNLLLRSEEFNSTIWTNGGSTTITPNIVPAPDTWFGNTADQVNTTTHITQTIDAKPNTRYTFSVWLRSATGSNQSVTVRLEDNGVILNQVRATTTVTISANEWRRVSLTGISQTPTSLFRPSIRAGNYYVWGAQLEEGPTVSGYVKTTDTAIERISVPLVLKSADLPQDELASRYCQLSPTLTRFALSAVVPNDGIISTVVGGYGSIKNNQTIQVWGAQFEEGTRPTDYIQTFNSPTTAYTTETIPLSTLEGDSGSMLWALLSSTSPTASAWKIVGQVFAYSNNPLPVIGYASRMDKIQQALDISPWDGTNITYTPRTPKYFTAFSVDEVTTKMGRKCYRVSNTNALSTSYNLENFLTPPIPIY